MIVLSLISKGTQVNMLLNFGFFQIVIFLVFKVFVLTFKITYKARTLEYTL